MAGLYIHIPFCHSKCSYCDFFSTPIVKTVDKYIDALRREWDLRRHEISTPFTTLYIGGGTPSILSIRNLEKIVRHIGFTNIEEMAIEANPEDVSHEWLESIKSLGFNRVSMGIQSFDNEELKFIGRRHSAQQAITASNLIKSSELRFNLDLIYGLPLQGLDSWKRNLETALEINPDHLSAYLLSYEEGTRLWAMKETGKIKETDESIIFEMYDYLIKSASYNGYRHYEISNFAHPKYEAIHNTNYWLGVPYLGLGVSAHSYDGLSRRVNHISIKDYIESLSRDETVFRLEDEDEYDRLNDLIITRLRMDTGLSLNEIPKWASNRLIEAAMPIISSERLILKDNRLIIPEKEFLRSDSIMRDLIFVH